MRFLGLRLAIHIPLPKFMQCLASRSHEEYRMVGSNRFEEL